MTKPNVGDLCVDCIYENCSFKGKVYTCATFKKKTLKIVHTICKNRKCNHILIGKDLRCPNQNCDFYDIPTVN